MSSNSVESNFTQATAKKDKQEIKAGRSLKLLEYLKTAFKGAVTTFSYAKIEQTFSELAKTHPAEFKKVYEEAVVEWKSNFNNEIQVIFKRHDVANKLAKIDHYIKTQTPISKFSENPFNNPNTNKRARTLLELDPVSVLKAAKIDVLRKEILDMKNKRKKIENENEKLYIDATRAKEELTAKAEALKTNFSETLNVANMLASTEIQSLMKSTTALSTDSISSTKD